MEPARVAPFVPETLAFLHRLVAENSYTLNAEGVNRNACLIAAQFEPLGFTAEEVQAEDPAYGRHLFLSRAGSGRRPGLLLVSHLDTVFSTQDEERDQFHWLEKGDRIYGPGIADIKGGTAMIWLVMKTLQSLEPELFAETSWLIAINAAEEVLVRDFAEQCQRRLPPQSRAAIVFENCGGLEGQHMLTRSRKGLADLVISVEGRGGHAGAEHQHGANAVVALSHLVVRLAAMTDYTRGLTFSVGRIVGGGVVNRIPHHASCVVNVRAFKETDLQEGINRVLAFQEEEPAVRAVSDGYPCRVRVELLCQHPAWPRNAATDALAATWMQAAERVGISLQARDAGGVSDANFLSAYLPALDGVGVHGRNQHSSQWGDDGVKVPEYILPGSYAEIGAVNVEALRSLLQEESARSVLVEAEH